MRVLVLSEVLSSVLSEIDFKDTAVDCVELDTSPDVDTNFTIVTDDLICRELKVEIEMEHDTDLVRMSSDENFEVKQRGVKWESVRTLLENIPAQPVVLEMAPGCLNVIFRYSA